MARRYETLAAASDRTGVSVKTLRRRIADGGLRAFRCGRLVRLDPDDVDGLFLSTAVWRPVPSASGVGR